MATQTFTNPLDDQAISRVDGSVSVGEDLHFQERWWIFENIIWTIFALILLADVLGGFGRGWLAKAEIHEANSGLDVKYERVERANTPSILSLHFRPEAQANGAVQLYISNSMIKDLGVQRVIPQPERSVIGNGGVTYTFPAQGDTALVDLELEPSFPGLHGFTLQVPGKQAVGGRVVVLP